MSTADGALSGIRILCVDDIPAIVEYLRFFLESKGASVKICTSAEKAIAILKEERFDVVISDLSMPPGLDGYDLAHALRKIEENDPTREATPTIAISGDALRPSRKRRFADFQVYMPKPIESARLVHVIERLAEADSDAVKLGSLQGWEAQQATEAAETATVVAAEATSAASDATTEAARATKAAEAGVRAAAKAEADASSAAAHAPTAGH